jgi:hypothetical protein
MKDYQHAARLYLDGTYAMSPKFGFIYYVILNINSNAVIDEQWNNGDKYDVGLLAKKVDLPKFKITTETLNQYNRKTIVQSKIDYQAVNIVFHDDNNNTTTGLWKAYYNYYFVDGKNISSLTIPPGFGDTKYKKIGTNINESTAFGLNNGQTAPFFSSIEIYQLNRKQFTAFILVNPIITDFSHDKLDQTQSKLLENNMTVQYETVLYGTGKVERDKPTGFATIHYDNTPGPLSIFGGGNNSILGPGGIIPGIGEILGGAGDTGPLGLFKTARGAAALVNNAKNISKASLLSEGYGILDKVARTGKLPDILTGKNPAGLALATLPGEQPTTATPRSQQAGGSGFNLGGLAAGIGGVVGGLTDKISGAIKGLLPSGSGTTAASIADARSLKSAAAASLESEIARNQGLREELDARIAAADGDPEAVEAIYAEYDSIGYTDPEKLQASLESVQLEEEELNQLFAEAEASETSNETLSEDEAAALFDQAENEENINWLNDEDIDDSINQIYDRNNDDDTTTYFA